MKKFIGIIGILLLGCQLMQAQDLTGIILKDGKPQKNVSVWLKIGKASATTDKSGHFALSGVLPEDTLQMSVSAKYDAKIVVGDLKNITINLGKEDFTVEGSSRGCFLRCGFGGRRFFLLVVGLLCGEP